MIIGVDAGCLGVSDERLKVGVYQVAANLFRQLKTIDTHNTYYLYSFTKIDKKLLSEFGPHVKNIVVKPVRGWTKIWLPLQILKDKPDIFLGLNQSLPLKLPLQTYRSIVIIHDVLFEEYPSLYPGSYRRLHRETKSAASIADSIIAVSEAAKKDIIERYKISPAKIAVAYEGVREFPAPRSVVQKKPYFLFVGALKPQKNIPFLLEGFVEFLKNTKGKSSSIHATGKKFINLVIVGGDKWMDKKIGKVLKNIPESLSQHIKFLGNVNDAELAYLYQNANAFISPSLSEGFGLPFLEALSFGIPVIGPKTGAVPEVVGNAGFFIDPTNKKQLIHAMNEVLQPQKRETLIKNAATQVGKFSWRHFAEIVLQTLEA